MLTWPLRHPRSTISIALVCALVSTAAVTRMHSNASLDAMLSRHSESTRALARVIDDFGTLDDLLVLAMLPDAANGPDPDGLLSFAARFEEQVAKSPPASGLTVSVTYRVDGQSMEFFRDVLVPSAVFYLDDASFAAARQRLTPEQMRRQMEQDQAMLATPSPAAGALSKAFMQDPLRLREFLLDQLAKQSPMKTYPGSEAFITEDGRALLIRVRGKRPPADLDFCKSFTRAIYSAASRANADGLKLEFTGSYAIAAQSAASIRSDMIASVVGSIIGLQLLFLLAYRGAIKLFVLALLPIALGVLIGFAGYALIQPTVTPLAAVLGGVLAGMAIDYSIQYLSHFHSRRSMGDDPRAAAGSSIAKITPAAFAAWITSIIGFLAVGASSVKMLRDFSVLGSIGLAGAFVAVVMLLPTLLMLTDRRPEKTPASIFRSRLEPLLHWIARHRQLCIAGSLALLACAAATLLANRGDLLPLESDLAAMHPRPNPALDAQAHLSQRFGIAPDSIIVHLRADSPDKLLSLAHEVDRRLKANSDTAGMNTYGLATLLPDPAVSPTRLAAIGPAMADRVVADYRTSLADAGFDSQARPLQDYAKFLQVLLTKSSAPSIADLIRYHALAETMLPRSAFEGQPPTEAITLLFPRENLADRALRDRVVRSVRAALEGLPDATPTGLSVAAYDTQAAIHHDLPRLIGLAVSAVSLYLALHFRSAADAFLAMLPTLFSLTLLLAAAHLAGQKLNMVNLVAIPLLIGIDVDYGVFLVSLARSRRAAPQSIEDLVARLAPVCHAVMMCALATIVGFGSLMWTSVPAVRSLGFVVAVGIGACLFAVLFLVVPTFLRLERANISRDAQSK